MDRRAPGSEAAASARGVGAARPRALVAVKLLHTFAWVFFVGCIVALPLAAWRAEFGVAAWLAAIVMVEVVVLAANRWACPLTAVAARYTHERAPNFDIYLPSWLARWNKHIFGPLYVAGLVFALWCYLRS